MKRTTIGKGLIIVLLTNTLVTAQDRRSEVTASWNLDAGNVWITGETLTLQVPGYLPARFNLKDTSSWQEVMLRHPELLPLAEEINAKGSKELELEAITNEEEAGEVNYLECARAITHCLGAAAAYVGGIYALITLCGGTLGLTCVGAVLAHPILAAAVGFECEEAAEKCSGGGKVGRDGKPIGQ